jgi:hypothetical protein
MSHSPHSCYNRVGVDKDGMPICAKQVPLNDWWIGWIQSKVGILAHGMESKGNQSAMDLHVSYFQILL